MYRACCHSLVRTFCSGAVAIAMQGTAFGHGALHERIEELSAAIARRPDDPALHFQLARVTCEHGDQTAALASLARVDELAPGKFSTDLIRGEAWLAAAQPAEAKAALDHFLTAHPGNAQALVLRARALKGLEKTEASLADFRAALQQTPNPEPELVRESADALATAGHSEEAVKVLAEGIEKLGAIPSLVLPAMEIEVATGRFDAALSRIGALQESAPRPEPWMAKRATVLAQAGRAEESRAAWQALITHLAALPNLERGSHAMSKLAEQAHQALAPRLTTQPLPTKP